VRLRGGCSRPRCARVNAGLVAVVSFWFSGDAWPVTARRLNRRPLGQPVLSLQTGELTPKDRSPSLTIWPVMALSSQLSLCVGSNKVLSGPVELVREK
jgi:hypothetical protein